MIYFFKANSNKVSFLYRKIMRNTSHKSNKNGGNDVYGSRVWVKNLQFFWKYSEIFFIYKKKRKAAGAILFYAIMVCNSTTM